MNLARLSNVMASGPLPIGLKSQVETGKVGLSKRGTIAILNETSVNPLWANPSTAGVEAVPRHAEIPNQVTRRMCRTGKNPGSYIEK